ncbi:MAG TPA: choice-of-anchor tandem repeat GloVer-containing protein [Candidatus Acidoferrum sp.]|jgi:uncharacterized repeat protein (TIGR03803 family)|nr:choice-of-anchor tandem repeat GloVer-containing protein [Candidatus Acidoferrum sp.]
MEMMIGNNAKTLFLLLVLLAGWGLILAGRVTAQTFTTLYSFTGGIDGKYPRPGLILSGSTLYGVAFRGGSSLAGSVFSVNIDGTGFATLYSFTGGSDGTLPSDGLVLSGSTLYGTAYQGGSSGNGTVFAVDTNNASFTTLHPFTASSGIFPSITNSDGANPVGGLILSSNTLYGTAFNGGSSGRGTLFAVNSDGTGFTNLHSFTPGTGAFPSITNSDGAYPAGRLIISGRTLYGTAEDGGSWGYGTVFKLNTDGTGFTTLHNFTGGGGGAYPRAGLSLSGNTLFGTTAQGGSSGNGTVFAVDTDATGFMTLYNFTAGSGVFPFITNSDGANPVGALVLSGNTLFGTAFMGGSSGAGTAFAVNINGTGFTTLHVFTAIPAPYHTNSDGAYPPAGLTVLGNTLFGIAEEGGGSGYGTVFSITLPPQLTIIPAGPNVILTWPTNATGFHLQKTVNLGPPAGWTTYNLIQPPTITNGQFVVTIPTTTTDTQQYYRLSQ